MISWNYEYEPFHIYRGSGSCWIPIFPQTKQLFKEQTVAERFSWLSSRRKYLPPLFFCGRRFCVRVLLYFFIKIYLRLSHLSTTNIRCSIESISCCSCWVPNKFNSTLLQSWTSLLIRRCSKCLWKRKWDTVHEVHRMYYWRAHCVHIDSIMHFIMRVYSRVCGLCFLKYEYEQLLQCHGVSELLQVFFCCTWIWINTKWDTENDSSLSPLSSLSCHLIVMFFD